MLDKVRRAFEPTIVTLPLDAILPSRRVPQTVRPSVKHKQIAASITEVGVVEPLVVARQRGSAAQYLLLDGHVRYAILRERGVQEAQCLVADDDEGFTYNKRVNRLATVQEHFMMVRAIERGVSAEKLAKALDIDVQAIVRRQKLLDGICAEVVNLFKNKPLNPVTFKTLRKMKPLRQIEAAELMAAAGNFSSTYAKALLAATRQQDLVRGDRPKKVGGMTPDQMARMEREMGTLHRDFKAVEASYGDDVLNLVIGSAYLSKLIENEAIEKYLARNHPEILNEFRVIVCATSLDESGGNSPRRRTPRSDRFTVPLR